MKSLIKPAGLVVVVGLLIFFGAKVLFTQEPSRIKPTRPPRTQDTTKVPEPIQKETYVSKVILQASWAEKNLVDDGEESPPGQFGIRVYSVPESLKEFGDAPPPEGPTSFTVAPNGDIYITDPFNERIQRFDENGNFVSVIPIPHFEKSKYVKGYQHEWTLICADRYNNVYLLWWEDYTEQYLCKYDQEGKLLATYPLFPEVRFEGGGKLYCDSSDTLFFEYWRKDTDKIMPSLKEELLLKKPYAPFTFQIGTADRVFSFEEQKRTLRKGVIKTGGAREIALHWSPEEGVTITKWYKQ